MLIHLPFLSLLPILVIITAAQRTDEANAAAIDDPTVECAAYDYPPVTALLAAGAFPVPWSIAMIATPAERALFNALSPSIPKISSKGAPDGNIAGVTYDADADPACWWTQSGCTTPKLTGLEPDITRCEPPNTLALSMDDGPDCAHNAYYDYLQSVNQKVSLFYIGSNTLNYPLEAQRGLDDGHEICSHTWSHPYMTALSNEQVFAELYYSKKAIKAVLGITVQCWRPPYGDVDDRVRYIAQALGLQTVIWEDDTADYDHTVAGPVSIDRKYDAIIAKETSGRFISSGTIMLSHELDAWTMGESQKYLPRLQAAFEAVVPVAVCLNATNPYVEAAFSYPDLAQWQAGTHSISLPSATAVSTDFTIAVPFPTNLVGSFFAPVPYGAGQTTINAVVVSTAAPSTTTPLSATSTTSTLRSITRSAPTSVPTVTPVAIKASSATRGFRIGGMVMGIAIGIVSSLV